jgi:carotenoid cleavage dioxygenase-like enzyme
MSNKIDRRTFLKRSGLGLAATYLPSLLGGCVRKYDSQEFPEFWKAANFLPVSEEVTETGLTVEGSLPLDLSGLHVRNGPNAWQGSTEHFFMGDGMLHGVRLEKGQAKWYSNRYVQTPLLYKEPGLLLSPPALEDNMSNVSLIHHGGKLLSLGEAGWAYEIDPEDLSTLGVANYTNKLQTAMTAHPKIDPDTGTMHFFGYNVFKPYLTYHQANAAGELIKTEPLDTNGPAMMHDFAMTEHYVIFMELPVLFSMAKAITMDPFPFGWDEDAVCRMGVLPKDGTARDMKWFDIPTCFIFHTMNAYEQGDEVVLDAARYDALWVKGSRDFSRPAYLSRYSLNMKLGTSTVTRINEQAMEFPQINRQQWGRNYRYGYSLTVGMDNGHVAYDKATGIMKLDLQTGDSQRYDFASGASPAEPLFVPTADATDEDHGYVLSYVYEPSTNTSDLWVMEAGNISAGPVAKVKLPVRVPFGFHGLWVPEEVI